MTIADAVIYFGLWILVMFFAVSWCKWFGWMIVEKFWEHALLAILFGLTFGVIWYTINEHLPMW